MRVAVAYAEAKRQLVLDVTMPDGGTVESAIKVSGIMDSFPELDMGRNKVGIFGKIVGLEQVLNEGDRVEIYRPALGSPPKKGAAAKAEEGGEETAPKRPTPAARAAAARAAKPAPATPAEAAPVESAPVAAAPAEAVPAEDKEAKIAAAKARAAAARAKLAAKKDEGAG